VNISSPEAFKCSVKKLKAGGIKPEERRAIKKAQLRAKIQLKRKDLSKKEKKEFRKIMSFELPKVTRPKKRKEKKVRIKW